MTKLLVTKEIGLWELIKYIGDTNITSKVFKSKTTFIRGKTSLVKVDSHGSIIMEYVKSNSLFEIKSYEELKEDTCIDEVVYSFKPSWNHDGNIIHHGRNVSIEEIIDNTHHEELLKIYSLHVSEDGDIKQTLIYENGEIV